MSGICGLFNFDNVRVNRAELAGMATMLEARGPDRTGLWQDGPVGLGHTLLTTTPEARFEKLPLRDSESGCVITADLRLDNREELLAALGLKRRRSSIGDAEIVLAAYLLWGEACVDRLLGDFAFAIFDPRRQAIFAARDPFGLKPFYYFHGPSRLFAFGSSAQSVLTLPQIPYRINDGRIADFLVPQLEWIDYTSTFFKDIYRLSPGHKISVTPQKLEITEYRAAQPESNPGSLTDEKWQEGLLEVFTQAVDARLRCPAGNLGSMLSGGMDSGSIVAVARSLLHARGQPPLPTYSAVRPAFADCAESSSISAATAMAHIEPTHVHPAGYDDTIGPAPLWFEEPFDGEFMMLDAVYRAASEDGRTVMLDGAAGDILLSEGTYITRLMRQGRLRAALGEIDGGNRFRGGSGIGTDVLRYAASAYLPDAIKHILRPHRQRRARNSFLNESLISPELLGKVDIDARFERMQHLFPGKWTPDYSLERIRAIGPNAVAGRERYGRLAARHGIEPRDPFLDRRVVEYCANLPGHLRLRGGWPKIILRDLMAGRLPDEVRWMRGKPHLGWLFNAACTRAEFRTGKLDLTYLRKTLNGYVERSALERAWQRFANGGDTAPIHSARLLAAWLEKYQNRPLVPVSDFGYSDASITRLGENCGKIQTGRGQSADST